MAKWEVLLEVLFAYLLLVSNSDAQLVTGVKLSGFSVSVEVLTELKCHNLSLKHIRGI